VHLLSAPLRAAAASSSAGWSASAVPRCCIRDPSDPRSWAVKRKSSPPSPVASRNESPQCFAMHTDLELRTDVRQGLEKDPRTAGAEPAATVPLGYTPTLQHVGPTAPAHPLSERAPCFASGVSRDARISTSSGDSRRVALIRADTEVDSCPWVGDQRGRSAKVTRQ